MPNTPTISSIQDTPPPSAALRPSKDAFSFQRLDPHRIQDDGLHHETDLAAFQSAGPTPIPPG